MSGPGPIDLRVLQANERTLLAWARTCLAVVAFGFVVARMGFWMGGAESAAVTGFWSGWIGSAFVALGTVSNAVVTVRYMAIRKAIVEGREILPGNAVVLTLAFGLVILGGMLLASLTLR